MAEARTIMPGDIPEWILEAEEARARGETFEAVEKKEITIKFGKGLVGEPFTSKSGHELVEVKIPNQDPEDKTPWASFVISPKMIHENKFGKGVWMKLPEDGTTRISKPIVAGTKEDGRKEWSKDVKEVTNTELKELMEVYKTRNKESLLGNLEDKKLEVEKRPARKMTGKTNNKGIAI